MNQLGGELSVGKIDTIPVISTGYGDMPLPSWGYKLVCKLLGHLHSHHSYRHLGILWPNTRLNFGIAVVRVLHQLYCNTKK